DKLDGKRCHILAFFKAVLPDVRVIELVEVGAMVLHEDHSLDDFRIAYLPICERAYELLLVILEDVPNDARTAARFDRELRSLQIEAIALPIDRERATRCIFRLTDFRVKQIVNDVIR